jgi:hypothetical protein
MAARDALRKGLARALMGAMAGMLRLALVIALLGALPGVGRATDHALLIGISDYAAAGLEPLPGALTDVQIVRAALRERLGLPDAAITTLVDAEATHGGIRAALADLAGRVAPGDFVYIHFSGYGSRLPGPVDEGEPGAGARTLVPFGTRTDSAAGLDRFDILDDDVNAWLAPIAARAGELVWVADAGHAATNTRGEQAPTARAAPPARQDGHPSRHAAPTPPAALAAAVRIGAAQEDRSAYELPYAAARNRDAGAFTANWVRSLHRAEPGESWRQVFERAAVWTAQDRRIGQRPRLSGPAERPLRGGRIAPRRTVPVHSVQGDRVALAAGRLSGVTVGSLYAAVAEDGRAARVRITGVRATTSSGLLTAGDLAAGDLLVEREHAYDSPARRLGFFASREPRDAPLLERVRRTVATLRGFEPAATAADADLILALLRPLREAGAARFPVTPSGRDSLPLHDPGAAPEVWVLNRGEALLHEDMAIRLDPAEAGLATLRRNLERYRRLDDLRFLAAEASGGSGLALALIEYAPCAPQSPDCAHLAANLHRRKLAAPLSPPALQARGALPLDQVLSFALVNTGRRARHAYLFELTPDGSIYVLFPLPRHPAGAARLGAGERRDLSLAPFTAGLHADQPGALSILLIGTQLPIDPTLLTQQGYERRRDASRSALRPLEALLHAAVAGGETRSLPAIATGTWGADIWEFQVGATDGAPRQTGAQAQ